MKLTSLDYADLLNWIAYNKYGALLNKTQINKLLFICYGMYLAATGGKVLFEDDTPKAWPYGPVFPRVYKNSFQEISLCHFQRKSKKNSLKMMLLCS